MDFGRAQEIPGPSLGDIQTDYDTKQTLQSSALETFDILDHKIQHVDNHSAHANI